MTLGDITTRIYKNTKTNASNYPAAILAVDINVAQNRVVSLINRGDGRWQWDDTNNTDLPIATTSLVSGQQDYSLLTSHLSIDRVEIMDTAGNWTELDPIDQHDVKRTALAQYLKTPGLPIQYDKLASSIFLYPTPNYSQAASLKIYFTRGPSEFTAADVTTGTKIPGFNTLFHDLIPLWVSYDYAIPNGLASASGFLAEIQRKEQELIDFYGQRSRDERPRLTVSSNRSGQWNNTSGRINYNGGDSNK